MSTAFRVGVFIFTGLLVLWIGIFLIGNKDFLFSSTYGLKADFQNVGGLNNGADVRVGGIHEGTVKEIDLPSQSDGKVTVVMNLRSATRNIIKKDSHATIKTEGLLGDKYIEISFGSTKGDAVQNGDTIASETTKDMSEQARALTDEAQAGVAAFRDNMEALQHNFLFRGFFEKRGYNDTAELSQHAISRLPARARTKEFEYDTNESLRQVRRREAERIRNPWMKQENTLKRIRSALPSSPPLNRRAIQTKFACSPKPAQKLSETTLPRTSS